MSKIAQNAPFGNNGNGRRGPGRPKGSKNSPGHKAGRPVNSKTLVKGRVKINVVPIAHPAKAAATIEAGLKEGLITPAELLKEIQNIALSDIADWPDCPESYRNAPEGFRRSIASLTIIDTVTTTKDGTVIERREVKPTFWSKPTAHDQLMRYHGMYAKDKTSINAQFNQFNQMNIACDWDLNRLTQEEIEALLAMHDKANPNGGEVLDLGQVRLPEPAL